jgi:WD40 repeat protein
MNNIGQYYRILGLELTASPEDIKKAYRKLVKVWHPDRHTDRSTLLEQAEIEIRKINQAYEIIQEYLTSQKLTPISKETTATPRQDRNRYRDRNNLSPAEVHYQQGTIYAKTERYTEAIKEFSQAIARNPYYIEAYQYRGFILAQLGYEHRAKADFEKIQSLKFQQPDRKKTTTASRVTSDRGLWSNIRTIVAHERAISCLAIDRNGRTFISGSYDRQLKLWKLTQREADKIFTGHTEEVNCVVITPDGENLVSGSKDKTIKIWNLKNGQLIRNLGGWFGGHKAEVVTMAIDPFNRILISGSADNLIKIWDFDRGKELQNISSPSIITSIAFSPDGRFFCSAGLEPQLRIRESQTGKVVRSLRANSGILSIAFSSNGNLIATGGFDRQITIWNWQTGKKINTLTGHLDRVSGLTFAKNSLHLISASWDKTIKLWNLQTNELIDTLTGHSDRILAMTVDPKYQFICSASADKTIKIWQKIN